MPRDQYVVVVGNPGVGKSTLLNGLCGQVVFSSGISFGCGLTEVLQTRTVGGVTYVDTPGLADVDRREQSAEQIKQALQLNGEHKLVFVLPLDMGALRPQDALTVKLVLDALPDGVEHSVVFNRLEPPVMEGLQEAGSEALNTVLTSLNTAGHTTLPRNVCLLPRDDELAGKNNQLMNLPPDHAFREFVEGAPVCDLDPQSVADIQHERFDELVEEYERKLQYLKSTLSKTRMISRSWLSNILPRVKTMRGSMLFAVAVYVLYRLGFSLLHVLPSVA